MAPKPRKVGEMNANRQPNVHNIHQGKVIFFIHFAYLLSSNQWIYRVYYHYNRLRCPKPIFHL